MTGASHKAIFPFKRIKKEKKSVSFFGGISGVYHSSLLLIVKCNNAEKSNHKVFIVMTLRKKKESKKWTNVSELHRNAHKTFHWVKICFRKARRRRKRAQQKMKIAKVMKFNYFLSCREYELKNKQNTFRYFPSFRFSLFSLLLCVTESCTITS